jgi:hypothetical protein
LPQRIWKVRKKPTPHTIKGNSELLYCQAGRRLLIAIASEVSLPQTADRLLRALFERGALAGFADDCVDGHVDFPRAAGLAQ